MAPPPLPADSPKGAHYRLNLGHVLVRGAWADPNPGATPNGSPLSWPELIRKWNKHTGGIIHGLRNVSLLDLSPAHHISPSLASSESSGRETFRSGSTSSYIHVPNPNAAAAAPGDRRPGSLDGSGLGVAPGAPGSLTRVISAPPVQSQPVAFYPASGGADGEDGASPSAWALGRRWGRMVDSSRADQVREGLAALERLISGAVLHGPEMLSAALTVAYHHHALGEYDAALSAYDNFDWASPATTGIVGGDAAVVERIRARTFQGICCELGSRPDANRALQCYLDAVMLLDRLTSSPIATPSYLTPQSAAPRSAGVSLEANRELFRHISTALTRAAVLTSRSQDHTLALRILRTYNSLASGWPSPFRAAQRQRMLQLYLAALHSAYPSAQSPPPDQYLLTGGAPARPPRPTWHAEVSEALRSGQRLLSETTSFPKAGEVNYPVSSFATQVSRFPDRSPAVAKDTVSVLWWATRFTFQSQAILRNLTRLLFLLGDLKDARRTFELYVGLVLKARQTLHPDAPLVLAPNPDDESEITAEAPLPMPDAAGNAAAATVAEASGENDTDEEFAGALLIGIRLLLVDLNEPLQAWRYACLAGDLVRMCPVNHQLHSKVEESKGIVRLALSSSIASPSQRPVFQRQAVKHQLAATQLDPSSASAFYHLAYAYAASRSVDPATDAIRTSLELDSQNVRAWHLLALLLTAAGDWEGAQKAGDAGVALWEADDEAATFDDSDIGGSAEDSARPLLLPSGEVAPIPHVPPRHLERSRRLESVIQLRMTMNVVTEKLYGPDVALGRQEELFKFFSQRTEPPSRPRSASTSRGRSGTMSTRAPSMSQSFKSSAPADLSGSYVITPAVADVQIEPPSPVLEPSGGAMPAPPPPFITTSSASSPANSSPAASEPETDGPRAPGRRRVVTLAAHKKSILQKHLHVPAVVRGGGGDRHGRGTSPERLRPSASTPNLSIQRQRTASQSTAALSIAPTAVHSHFHGSSRSAIPPPPPPLQRTSKRSPAEERILSDLWLQSAASFRRAGKLEQALVAIEEAETHAPDNEAVWVQLGLWHLAAGGAPAGAAPLPHVAESALAGFTKALLLKPDYPPAVVSLARLYLSQNQVDLSHSLLSQITEDGVGWDVPEAWYSLASVAERQGRRLNARECLLTALELQRSRPCRGLNDALERWL